MTIEIVSIGNELLSGRTVNSNASRIAETLCAYGYSIERITTLPDDLEELKLEMAEALNRSAIVIATGGLGPTQDDKTRMAIADLVGRPLVTDQEELAALKARFGSKLSILRNQASIPKGAAILSNLLGTAVGFTVEVGESFLIVLPGVPAEMEIMLKEQALPLIRRRLKEGCYRRSFFFCLLCEYQFDAALRALKSAYPLVDIGICPSYGIVSIYLNIKAASQGEAAKLFEEITLKVQNIYPTHLFSTESIQVERALHQTLFEKECTFAVAESCTGGKLASRMAALPGASTVFLGGVVAYSNLLKEKLLGVSSKTLEKWGAVSEQTVTEMAEGLFNRIDADYVLTVSGIAGPDGGTAEKPVGTVWVALGDRNGDIYTHCLHRSEKMGRNHIIDYVSTYLLASLWRYLAHGEIPFKESR